MVPSNVFITTGGAELAQKMFVPVQGCIYVILGVSRLKIVIECNNNLKFKPLYDPLKKDIVWT